MDFNFSIPSQSTTSSKNVFKVVPMEFSVVTKKDGSVAKDKDNNPLISFDFYQVDENDTVKVWDGGNPKMNSIVFRLNKESDIKLLFSFLNDLISFKLEKNVLMFLFKDIDKDNTNSKTLNTAIKEMLASGNALDFVTKLNNNLESIGKNLSSGWLFTEWAYSSDYPKMIPFTGYCKKEDANGKLDQYSNSFFPFSYEKITWDKTTVTTEDATGSPSTIDVFKIKKEGKTYVTNRYRENKPEKVTITLENDLSDFDSFPM